MFYYPALMHVKILAPEFGAAGYKDLDSSSSLYAEIPQEMIWNWDTYSQVPNKRVGPNKQVGWLFWANFINE